MPYLLTFMFMFSMFSGSALAQFSTFSDSSGNSGTIYNYGNGFESYQDSRGTTGTIYNYGNGFQSYQFNGPNGQFNSGTIYTFPSPGSSFGSQQGQALVIPSPPAGAFPLPQHRAPTPLIPITPCCR